MCLSTSLFVMQRALFSFPVTSRWTIILCLGAASGLFIEWIGGPGHSSVQWGRGVGENVRRCGWDDLMSRFLNISALYQPLGSPTQWVFWRWHIILLTCRLCWLMIFNSQMVATPISITYKREGISPQKSWNNVKWWIECKDSSDSALSWRFVFNGQLHH